MISAEHAITRFRRDMAMGMAARALLLAGAVAGVFVSGMRVSNANTIGTIILTVVMVVWFLLSHRSARRSRQVADSTSLIAAGRFDEAEKEIEQVLTGFSLLKAVKLIGLHHLAMLRHAEKRYKDAAELCKTLLNQRLGAMANIARPTKLIMADALLETGDLQGAYAALSGLYAERLSLGEAMRLQVIQLDYMSRINAWEPMLASLATKVQLAEIMPAHASARAQALLALAARKAGRSDWEAWLRARAELLAESAQLCAERPVLAELWPLPETA